MTSTFASFRELVLIWIRECLSTEQRRRDAVSAASSFVAFWIFLYLASHGFMPSYMQIDRAGRVMAVNFKLMPEIPLADIAQTRLEAAPQHSRVAAAAASPQPKGPPRAAALSAMAASRPDYFGRSPILPPARPDRTVSSDIPEQWHEDAKRLSDRSVTSDRTAVGPSSVSMPSARISSGAAGDGESSADITFDVGSSPGVSRGSDFITLTGRTSPSSVGRPGGTDIAVRRPVIRAPLPVIPEWFERKGLNTFVLVRAVVSASGKVEQADVESTSGFKELDAEARTAILQWQFVQSGVRESLVIKIKYKLE